MENVSRVICETVLLRLSEKIEDTSAVHACSLRVVCANFLPFFQKNFLPTRVLKSRARNFDADALCLRYVRHAKYAVEIQSSTV